MAYLVDTSILVRLANVADPFHASALTTVILLHREGESLRVAPQNLIEFRACATRPVGVNGLGLAPFLAEQRAAAFASAFSLVVESADIFNVWKRLVSDLAITGKQVHDARIAAICEVNQLTHLLTFNVAHFRRLAVAAGFQVVAPVDVKP